jgi:hypothetical protein
MGYVIFGTATLNGRVATLSGISPTVANGFAVGGYTVKATYTPASGSLYTGSYGTSPLTVTAPAYTITPPTGPISLSQGGSQSMKVALASSTFADTVTLGVVPSSSLISVKFTNPTVVLTANGTGSTTLTIIASGSAANHAPSMPWTGGLVAFGAVLGSVRLARRHKRAAAVLMTALAISALGFMISCGGGGGGSSSTAPASRNYTVTITGSGNITSVINVAIQ